MYIATLHYRQHKPSVSRSYAHQSLHMLCLGYCVILHLCVIIMFYHQPTNTDRILIISNLLLFWKLYIYHSSMGALCKLLFYFLKCWNIMLTKNIEQIYPISLYICRSCILIIHCELCKYPEIPVVTCLNVPVWIVCVK